MKTTIMSAMMAITLLFCLGVVPTSYAGVIDLTDPENPKERFLEIDISGMNFSNVQDQMISLSVDATDVGIPVGDVTAQFKVKDQENFSLSTR